MASRNQITVCKPVHRAAHHGVLIAKRAVQISRLQEPVKATVDIASRTIGVSDVDVRVLIWVPHVLPVLRALEIFLRVSCLVERLSHFGNAEVIEGIFNCSRNGS